MRVEAGSWGPGSGLLASNPVKVDAPSPVGPAAPSPGIALPAVTPGGVSSSCVCLPIPNRSRALGLADPCTAGEQCKSTFDRSQPVLSLLRAWLCLLLDGQGTLGRAWLSAMPA